ncbi:MAG: FAD-dependent oxidoreductase [Gemmatimonadota bacterium]
MKLRVVVLGAGFGGLELSTTLSDALGDRLELTLIDKNDSFAFGFSKIDVMFARQAADDVRVSYGNFVKPGVVFRQETITAIDPQARRVTTDVATYEADVLVIALGADYDFGATPGLSEGGQEFYSWAGAERLRDLLPNFSSGHAVIGVTSAPFKCPPAPSEAALLLHDHLTSRGVRDACKISLVMAVRCSDSPVPCEFQRATRCLRRTRHHIRPQSPRACPRSSAPRCHAR